MKRVFSTVATWMRTFLKYSDLFILLVQRDLKMKYRRSFLGYLWSILNPLLTMVVLSVVFVHLLKKKIDNFPVYLICGYISFSFMRESTNSALNSVISNASLIKKTYVPKYIFTLSKISSSFVNYFLSLGALLIVMIATGVPFRWINLLIIIPIAELYVFCVGLGLVLAAVTVFFRDMKNLWSVVTLAWMYLTPMFYSLDNFLVKGSETELLPIGLLIRRFNPMYMFIQQIRSFILDYHPIWEVPAHVLMFRGACVSCLMLIAGILIFNSTKDRFILHI